MGTWRRTLTSATIANMECGKPVH